MLRGDLGAVASAALGEGGAEALAAFRLEVGRPVAPMLASTAPDVEAALEKTGPAAVEWKLDGARIQVHRSGDAVGIFTRSLDDVTARLPEVVDAVLSLDAASFVLDGEAIALREDGRPHPVPGHRLAVRLALGRHGAADADVLRRAAPGRRGPAGPAGGRARGGVVGSGARARGACRAAGRNCSSRRWP